MPSKVAHVRLPEEELRFIELAVEDGYFTSRTDFIRSAIRLQIHEMSRRKIAQMKRGKKKVMPHAELLKSIKRSRREVYKETWG